MRSRSALPVSTLLLVVAALAAYVAWPSRDAPRGVAPAAPDAHEAHTGAAPRDVRARPPEVAAARAEAGAGAPTAAPPPDAAAPRWTLAGTAERVDAQGARFRDEDGRLVLAFEGAAWTRAEVAVRAGRWSLEVAPGTGFAWVDALELGGRALALEEAGFEVARDGATIALVGRELHAVRLHVRAAADGAELDEVDVVAAEQLSVWEARPHAPEAWVAQGARSPVTLPPSAGPEQRGVVRYWVRARGAAWGALAVDHTAGGERELRLDAARALLVRLDGAVAGRALRVCVRDPEDEASAAADATWAVDGVARFEALPRRALVVDVLAGPALRPPPVASARVGATDEELALFVPAPVAATPVTVRGTLALPPGHDALAPTLRFAPVGGGATVEDPAARLTERAREASGAARYAFEIELPDAGPYLACVAELAWQTALDVPPGGLAGVELRVPELARVVVRLVAAESGAPLAGAAVTLLGEHAPSALLARASPDAPGRYVATLCAGHVQLLARVDGRASAVRELEARPGEQELRVELALECGLALEFHDGAARVPFDEGARLALRDAAGAPVPPSWDSHGTLFLPAPGAYRLDVTGFAGFEDVRDLAVRLERTGFEPWRVDLVRRP